MVSSAMKWAPGFLLHGDILLEISRSTEPHQQAICASQPRGLTEGRAEASELSSDVWRLRTGRSRYPALRWGTLWGRHGCGQSRSSHSQGIQAAVKNVVL